MVLMIFDKKTVLTFCCCCCYFLKRFNPNSFDNPTEKIQLPPGTQNYKFQCNLPFGLPTSVEHEVGHITYGVKLVMDVPFWLDTKFKEHFTVIKPINLNEDPSFRVI